MAPEGFVPPLPSGPPPRPADSRNGVNGSDGSNGPMNNTYSTNGHGHSGNRWRSQRIVEAKRELRDLATKDASYRGEQPNGTYDVTLTRIPLSTTITEVRAYLRRFGDIAGVAFNSFRAEKGALVSFYERPDAIEAIQTFGTTRSDVPWGAVPCFAHRSNELLRVDTPSPERRGVKRKAEDGQRNSRFRRGSPPRRGNSEDSHVPPPAYKGLSQSPSSSEERPEYEPKLLPHVAQETMREEVRAMKLRHLKLRQLPLRTKDGKTEDEERYPPLPVGPPIAAPTRLTNKEKYVRSVFLAKPKKDDMEYEPEAHTSQEKEEEEEEEIDLFAPPTLGPSDEAVLESARRVACEHARIPKELLGGNLRRLVSASFKASLGPEIIVVEEETGPALPVLPAPSIAAPRFKLNNDLDDKYFKLNEMKMASIDGVLAEWPSYANRTITIRGLPEGASGMTLIRICRAHALGAIHFCAVLPDRDNKQTFLVCVFCFVKET